MTRGLFCLSGVGAYDADDTPNLTEVPEEIRLMRRALTALGLTELFPFDGDERGHEELEVALDDWADSTPATEDETLLIYSTGHGTDRENRYRLLLPNGMRFAPERLLENLGERRSLRQVVMIVDACFGESGVDSALLEMRLPGTRTSKIDFWGIGSSRKRETAAQRTFAAAFAASLARHSCPSWTVSHFQPQVIVDEVDRELGPKQSAWIVAGHSAGGCLALPNPRYQSPKPPVDLPLRGDWAIKARGVADANKPGFFFTGRDSALTDLRAHVEDGNAPSVLVVTGGAGTGKSALLGHFVLTAVGSEALPVEARLRWPALSADVIACRGERGTVLRTLARGLGLPGHRVEDIVSALRDRNGRTVVVLDQLSEDEEWDDVLTALADVPDVRLVLGLPTSTAIRLRTVRRTLDLDALGTHPDEDVRAYIALRLTLAGASDAEAKRLAARWGLTFDVALAAVGGYEMAAARPGSRPEVWADRAATEAAKGACRALLAADLDGREGAVVDALWALCSYNNSIALPAREWAAAASDPAGDPVTAGEIASAAARLDRFVESRPGETGLPRWRPRLCFEALSDDGLTEDGTQHRVRTAGMREREQFLVRLPQLAAPREFDWDEVDPAVRTLIALGASVQTRDGRLLDKPWFLLDVPPPVVQEAMRYLTGLDRSRRSLLMRAVSGNGTRPERTLLLGIAAHRYEVRPVADALAVERPAHHLEWVHPDRPRVDRLAKLLACSPTVAVTVDGFDGLDFWAVGDGERLRHARVPGVPRTVTVASVAGAETALVTTRQGELWLVPCRGAGEPELRPDLIAPATGRATQDLAVALHPGGQVVVGAGRRVWAADPGTGRTRHLLDLDSDLHALHLVGSVDAPVLWCVTNAGRIHRLWPADAGGAEVTPFPLPRTPLFTAASPDGLRLLVADVARNLHLRSAHGESDLLGAVRVRDARAIAVDDRFAVVAGAGARGLGWLELHDLTKAGRPVRVPLDEAPVGIALPGSGRVLVARPAGLLALTPQPMHADVPVPSPRTGGRP